MMFRTVRDIQYSLMPGTDRNTTDIVIERNGEIVVRPPMRMQPEQVDEIVESKRLWIYRNLAEWRDLNSARTVREWVSGETFLYLGRNYRLKLVSDQKETLKILDGRFCLRRDIIEREGPSGAKMEFRRFYKRKGLQRIAERVPLFSSKIGVTPDKISVKEIGHKWGACTARRNLMFHWKCMMAPSKVLDYIVVHELCHLKHRNHTDVFWNEVDKVMPDYQERKAWLRENGASMDF